MTKRLHQISLLSAHKSHKYVLLTSHTFFYSGDREFTFAIKGETEYNLNKDLEVGDELSVFGHFKDHTTSKFR